MVGTDPGFICLSVPFTWTARVKQSVSKYSEHIPNTPVGLKSFRRWETNLFFFLRMLPLDGEVCIQMPNSLLETRLLYCTTQRLGGILEVVNTEKIFEDVSRLSELHMKLATTFWCDANMTSLPFWLISANSFLIRPVFFESSNGGWPKPGNKVKITWLPVRIFKLNLAW